MQHRHVVWLVGLCLAWPALGISSSGQTSAIERSVMQAIEQINAAFQQRNVKAYEALTTSDFVRINSTGRVFGRSEWLKTVAAPGVERGPAKFDQLSVRVYGNASVVTYRNLPTGAGGQPGAVSYLTRIMAKQGEQWTMALAQSTDTQPPAAPTGPEQPRSPLGHRPLQPSERLFQSSGRFRRRIAIVMWPHGNGSPPPTTRSSTRRVPAYHAPSVWRN
jgi:ketosteroid isomerase-like protein